jgi:hypothetical protein
MLMRMEGGRLGASTSIRFAASLPGSFWWEIGTMLQRAMAAKGTDVHLEPSTFDMRNVRAVGSGACELGVTMPPFLDWANSRRGPLADFDGPELVVIAAINQPVWLAAAADEASGLASLTDLVEQKYPWRPVSHRESEFFSRYVDRILGEHGITRDDLEWWGGGVLPPTSDPAPPSVMPRIDYPPSANGFFLYTSWTVQWARDLTSRNDLRFLRFDEDALDRVVDDLGGQKLRMPQRLYPGVEEDLAAVGWMHHYVYGTTETDADLVRSVLDALDDAGDDLLLNAQGHSYTSHRAPKLVPRVDMHPVAAERYSRPQ